MANNAKSKCSVRTARPAKKQWKSSKPPLVHHVTLVIPRARRRCRHCDCDACKNQSAFYKRLRCFVTDENVERGTRARKPARGQGHIFHKDAAIPKPLS